MTPERKKQLRELADYGGKNQGLLNGSCVHELLDEVERLNREIEIMQARPGYTSLSIGAMKEENARLRAIINDARMAIENRGEEPISLTGIHMILGAALKEKP